MHLEAILTAGGERLAVAIGSLVKAKDVLAAYGTSESTRFFATFRCADEKCGKTARLRAARPERVDRKTTMQPHFVARHIKGCEHKKIVDAIEKRPPPEEALPGSPKGKGFATIWKKPPEPDDTKRSQRPSKPLGDGSDSESEETGRVGRTRIGDGTSKSSSYDIGVFATGWLEMSKTERQSTNLVAPWNPGRTFDSAMRVLRSMRNVDLTSFGERCYFATIAKVARFQSGFAISLDERDLSRLELRIFIRHEILNRSRHGLAIRTQLELGNEMVNRPIFGLGTFEQRVISATFSVCQLTIDNEYKVFVSA